jgi:NAD(P)-dependent dehydrogenase (short-subunit alcohol dehydrogenase family)
MRFEGRVLLATGGGSGLGEAVARRFTADGGRVAIVDLDPERAQAVAAELSGAIGIGADVSDEDGVRDAVASARRELGSIDCVFNGAGYAEFHSLEKWTMERWNQLIAVHLGGTFLVCKHAVPALRESGGGAIVNVASIGAVRAYAGNHAYAAAKGGVLSLTRVLALELAPTIRVNVVSPGPFRTRMTEEIFAAIGGGDLQLGMQQSSAPSPARRIAEPEEIGGPVCFLLSADASYITGANLPVDGGRTIVSAS